MLKSLYKTVTCRFDAIRPGGCSSGDRCCFRHSVDDEHSISQRVAPIRQEVFNELYKQNFALPLEILSEIHKVSDQEYDIRQDRKDEFRERQERRRTKPRRSRSAMSTSSNEQRVNPSRTPTPQRPVEVLEIEEIRDASDIRAERQRALPSGISDEDEHSATDVEEAAASVEANDNDINMEALPETEQTPLLAVGNGDGAESTPQLVNEATDDAMALDPVTEGIVETTYAGADVVTGLQEGIVDA